jgi:hypothetical protein
MRLEAPKRTEKLHGETRLSDREKGLNFKNLSTQGTILPHFDSD